MDIIQKYKLNQKSSLLKPPLRAKPKTAVVGIALTPNVRKPQKTMTIDLQAMMQSVGKSRVNKSASATSLQRKV